MKIITLEDPIEYRIEGIEQTQVDDEAGYTFGNGLRAIVRQDPDVILVGEVRDLETADIALEAALTGHLVGLPPRSTTFQQTQRGNSRNRAGIFSTAISREVTADHHLLARPRGSAESGA